MCCRSELGRNFVRHITTRRLLTLLLTLSVCVFIAQGVNHWHADGADEQHCQVCHASHTAVPRPVIQAITKAPFPVARFAGFRELLFDFEPVFTQRIPRAPPV